MSSTPRSWAARRSSATATSRATRIHNTLLTDQEIEASERSVNPRTMGVPDLRGGAQRLDVRFIQFDNVVIELLQYRDADQPMGGPRAFAEPLHHMSPAFPRMMHICFHIRDDVDFNKFIADLEAESARRGMTQVRANRVIHGDDRGTSATPRRGAPTPTRSPKASRMAGASSTARAPKASSSSSCKALGPVKQCLRQHPGRAPARAERRAVREVDDAQDASISLAVAVLAVAVALRRARSRRTSTDGRPLWPDSGRRLFGRRRRPREAGQGGGAARGDIAAGRRWCASEPNNRLYFLHEDVTAPGHFVFYEIFATQGGLRGPQHHALRQGLVRQAPGARRWRREVMRMEVLGH